MHAIMECISAMSDAICKFLYSYSSADFQNYAIGFAALLGIYLGRRELSKSLIRDQLVSRLKEVTNANVALALIASREADKYSKMLDQNHEKLSSDDWDEWVNIIENLNDKSFGCTGDVRAYCMIMRDLSIKLRNVNNQKVQFSHSLYRLAYFSCYNLTKICKPVISSKPTAFVGDDATRILNKIQINHLDLQDGIVSPTTKLIWVVLESANADILWRKSYATLLRSNTSLMSYYLEQYKFYFPPFLEPRNSRNSLAFFASPVFSLINVDSEERVGPDAKKRDLIILTYANIDDRVKIGNKLNTYISRNYREPRKSLSMVKFYSPKMRSALSNEQMVIYEIDKNTFKSNRVRFLSYLNLVILKFRWRKILKRCKATV